MRKYQGKIMLSGDFNRNGYDNRLIDYPGRFQTRLTRCNVVSGFIN
ncbi:MAG: hypothetical protein ACTSVI_13000 [Promethearchaeota archaeon]